MRISLSCDLNSSITVSLTLSLSTPLEVKCSNKVTLLSIIWLGSISLLVLYVSNKVYNKLELYNHLILF